ncbi:MAG: hypothetical protein QM723_03475 [Myxococcaceae bacterium]
MVTESTRVANGVFQPASVSSCTAASASASNTEWPSRCTTKSTLSVVVNTRSNF